MSGVVLKRPVVEVSLPQKKNVPSGKIGDYTVLLYGEKKIGKTSLCSMFPNAFFMQFEPGGKGLETLQENVNSWQEFLAYVKLLRDNPDYCDTIIIDTVDVMYERAHQRYCQKEMIVHPQDQPYGKGYAGIADMFKSGIQELLALNKGLIFISHATTGTFTERGGGEYNKIVPSMSNQASKYMVGLVDIVLYYGYYATDRYITVHGASNVEAGCRVRGRFKTPDGRAIHSIPCGNNEEDTYDNLMLAFHNKQEDPCEPDGITGLSGNKVNPMAKKK